MCELLAEAKVQDAISFKCEHQIVANSVTKGSGHVGDQIWLNTYWSYHHSLTWCFQSLKAINILLNLNMIMQHPEYATKALCSEAVI